MHLSPLDPRAALSITPRRERPAPNAPAGDAAPAPADGVALSQSAPLPAPTAVPSPLPPLQPQAGEVYQANQDQPRPIALSFDDAAAQFVKNANLQVDLENAQLLTEDGRRIPLDGRIANADDLASGYAVQGGHKLEPGAEPWQFRVPGTPPGIFGKPFGVLLAGGEQGLAMKFLDAQGQIIDRSAPGLDDTQGMRVDIPVFRTNRRTTLGKVASHVPNGTGLLGPASLPFTETGFRNVTLRAPSKESLGVAKEAFGKLLGSLNDERAPSVDLNQLKVYENHFQQILEAEVQKGGEIDGMALMRTAVEVPEARQALSNIVGSGAESLSHGELLQAAGEKVQRACPLEIVVIPKDKSAADCVEVADDEERQRLEQAGRAWFQTTDALVQRAQTSSNELPVQRLFVGEEILQSEQGVKAVLIHELLHVFEQRYASPDELTQISESFAQAREFQSLYGSSRDEYLTTVSEEFQAAHGADGPAWVEREHPQMFTLLSNLLGQPG